MRQVCLFGFFKDVIHNRGNKGGNKRNMQSDNDYKYSKINKIPNHLLFNIFVIDVWLCVMCVGVGVTGLGVEI